MDKTLINAAIADSRVQKGLSVYLTMCLKVSWMMLRVTAGDNQRSGIMLTVYSWRQMLTEGSVGFAQAVLHQLWNSRNRTLHHEQGTLTFLDHFVEGLGTRPLDTYALQPNMSAGHPVPEQWIWRHAVLRGVDPEVCFLEVCSFWGCCLHMSLEDDCAGELSRLHPFGSAISRHVACLFVYIVPVLTCY